jgi:hypothetical protein
VFSRKVTKGLRTEDLDAESDIVILNIVPLIPKTFKPRFLLMDQLLERSDTSANLHHLDFVNITFSDPGLKFLVSKWRSKKLCGGSNFIEKGLVIRSDLNDALC